MSGGHDHASHARHGLDGDHGGQDDHGSHAGHDHAAGASERSLRIALALTGGFCLVEAVGGVVTQSLALISDAAHMLTDVVALAIALVAIRLGRRVADARRTFGYARFEILAAAFNAMMLFAVAVYILVEAWLRLKSPPELHSTGMLAIAAVGLVVNLISMKVLAAGKDDSLNLKGAYLEVWSDMLGSVGVIVGAVVVMFTGWWWVDSVVAVLIGVWVFPRTWILLRASVNVLLEGVPEHLDLGRLRASLGDLPDVESLHDLHVWSLSSGKVSLTAHAVCADATRHQGILDAAAAMLARDYGITHVTLQCELTPCAQAGDEALQGHFRPAG